MNHEHLLSLSSEVIGCAMRVHTTLGPGLLESVYEACLAHELLKSGIDVDRQVLLPVEYQGERIDCGFRIDLLVQRRLVLELKTVDQFAPVHQAQIMTYLKLMKLPVGLLINFNVVHLKDGIRRVVLG